jgi:Zn-dependent peptidase ImmA (M78 family)
MTTRVSINTEIITWAISRAGFQFNQFTEKHPHVLAWLDGPKEPTIKQAQKFSKQVYLPFGYLFLENPIDEEIPIPFFRTNEVGENNISINTLDTINLLQHRQDWLKDYLKSEGFEEIEYVGQYNENSHVEEIVSSIREKLQLPLNWAIAHRTWEETLTYITAKIEDIGVIVSFNGVVENNNYRHIEVEDCRGFVIVDNYVPFMFINNSDSKAAQMFTIIHELAHIWTGQSAGFDFRKLMPAENQNEKLCDMVAAEFLVSAELLKARWLEENNYIKLSKQFKVSPIVIARRALDLNLITRQIFFNFYDTYMRQEFYKKQEQANGGDFFRTVKKRLSLAYITHVNNAVRSGKLMYKDAYKLTSLRGDTFQNLVTNYM